MRLFKLWYGRWLASKIEDAYRSGQYDNIHFLCTVIHRRNFFSSRLVTSHIERTLCGYATLRNKLEDAVHPGTLPWRWDDREVYHRRYWNMMCKALRKGDLKWGRVIDLNEMGMTHMRMNHG